MPIFDLAPCVRLVASSSCYVFLYVIPPSLFRSTSAPSPKKSYFQLLRTDVFVFSSQSVAKPLLPSVFLKRFNRFDARLLPDVMISDVVQPGLPSCPFQHPHFGCVVFAVSSFFLRAQHSEAYVISGLMMVLKTLSFNSTGISHYPGYCLPLETPNYPSVDISL